jgi:hypothetical protein
MATNVHQWFGLYFHFTYVAAGMTSLDSHSHIGRETLLTTDKTSDIQCTPQTSVYYYYYYLFSIQVILTSFHHERLQHFRRAHLGWGFY